MRALLPLLPLLLLITMSVPGQATISGDALERRIEAGRAALERAQTQAAVAERRSAALARRAEALRSSADADEVAAAALAARIQAAEAAVAASAARVQVADGLRTRQLQELRRRQGPLLDLLARLQLLVRRPPLTLLAEPGSATTLVHARALISTLLPLVEQRTDALKAQLAVSRRAARVQRLARDRYAADRQELAARRAELARSELIRRTQAARVGARSGLEADAAQALAQRVGDLNEMMREVASLSAVRDRLARLPGPVPRPGSMPASAGSFVARITAGDRPAWQPPVIGDVVEGLGTVDGTGRRSRGMVIAAPGGAQVVAPAGGRVMFAGPFRSFGQVAIIDHGDGWTTLITGMLTVQARVGDAVVAGSPLGRAGPGSPRIGVELRHNGVPADMGTRLY
jgi:septal ring factor EnvC (AmiA/AmiB activator)